MLKYLRKTPFINRIVRNILAKSHKFFSLAKQRWRVAGIIPINFHGVTFRMYSQCDDGILEPLYYGFQYSEQSDLLVFTSFIDQKSVILDIGANTGIYSILSAKLFDNVQVHSFEPNPINLKRLEKNISINALTNIKVVPKAVGSEKKKIAFNIPEKEIISDTSSAIEKFSKSTYKGELTWKSIEVEQISIDSYCQLNELKTVDLIKIDVEGYELHVLEGAKKTLKDHQPIILLETFQGEEGKAKLQYIVQENGYFIYTILSEGIIKLGQKFEEKFGLNYLLLNFETETIFTPLKALKNLRKYG